MGLIDHHNKTSCPLELYEILNIFEVIALMTAGYDTDIVQMREVRWNGGNPVAHISIDF